VPEKWTLQGPLDSSLSLSNAHACPKAFYIQDGSPGYSCRERRDLLAPPSRLQCRLCICQSAASIALARADIINKIQEVGKAHGSRSTFRVQYSVIYLIRTTCLLKKSLRNYALASPVLNLCDTRTS